MSAVASPMSFVQQILAEQPRVGRPSAETCSVIAGLKDLCDLAGGPTPGWRSGVGGPTTAGGSTSRFGSSRPTGNGGNRPTFRSSAPSTPVGGSPGGLSPLGVNMRRVESYGSTVSTGSQSTTATATPSSVPNYTGPPPGRYQSKFKNSSQPVEDKILNNIILSKLNKFSPATYADIREFLYQILGSGEPDLAEMIRDFMMLVFRKAAAEEVYCGLYAKLLAEISDRYKVILEEMHKLQSNYLEIFDDVVEIPEGGDEYAVFVAKNREKRYRQGYSQFLAELTALEILELGALDQTFTKLFSLIQKYGAEPDKRTLVEEYVDCLIRMSRVLRKKQTPFFQQARKQIQGACSEALASCIEGAAKYPSLSPKAKFLLMDVRDILLGN